MRALGKTGIAVSEVGFGTGDNAGLLVQGDRRSQIESVARALEGGVNYFDMSPDYGKGLAEFNVGSILRELHMIDKVVLSTKCELYPNQAANFDKAVELSVNASLGRLGVECIDVYLVHNAPRAARVASSSTWIPVTVADLFGPIREGLQRALQQGKVKHVGIACDRAQPGPTKEVLDSGMFEVANLNFNLANPTCLGSYAAKVTRDEDYDGILDACGENNVGVAVIRPLAGGALTDAAMERGAEARHPVAGGSLSRPGAFEAILHEADGARAAWQQLGIGMTELAYRWLLSQRQVTTILGGYSELSHLDDILAASAKGPLSADELEVVYSTIS
jgi:aryl-alcohol dehydrogenase-like predicted oxidoreductase